MINSATVVTITRGRPELLKRAIDSVLRQDYNGELVHLVIIDECCATRNFLESVSNLPNNLIWHWLPREADEESGPSRLAKLRNFAVNLVDTWWISFLDDDNEFEPNHISSLVSCALTNKCRAVHSHMQIFRQDGTPYLEPRMPWCRDPDEGRRLYAELCTKGIFQPGSNIARDRADPWDHPNPARTVDTGEWLFERTLLIENPFCVTYRFEDWANVITEDDKLLEDLVKNRIPIACSYRPTLKYYLGGYSNAFPLRDQASKD